MLENLEKITSKAVEKFRGIRDIEYIVGGGHERVLFEQGFGTCTMKHLKLKEDLENLEYEIRIRISYFDWKDLPFPEEILNSLGENTIEPHMSLYFKLDRYKGILD